MASSSERSRYRYSLRGLLFVTALAAFAALLYRNYYVPPLTEITGLTVETHSEQSPEVLFDQAATLRTAEQLLSHLKDGSTFWFYDSQKEAISDPGVFVTITRQAGDYLVAFSNHGWSTGWVSVPREDIVQYLWACRDDNRKGKPRFYTTPGMRLRFDAKPELRVDEKAAPEILEHIRRRINSKK